MLLFITLFLFVVSIIACILVRYIDNKCSCKGLKGINEFIYYHSEGASFVTGIMTLAFGATILIMTVCLLFNYISAETEKTMNQEIYDSLIYKVETEAIRDDFGIVNKEYVDEIQKWNADLVGYQTITHNFWIGIFYPDWYDEFETIDLNNIKMKE